MHTGIIWDFDGTLFDTYPSIARALCRALDGMGFEAPYEEAYALSKLSIGHAVRRYAGRFGLDGEELMEQYRRIHHSVDAGSVPLFPHIREILEETAARGGRSFIFTHRGDSTLAYLKGHGIERLFTDVVSSDHGYAHKPDPAGNLHIMRKYGLLREETIAVGDRAIDILAAANAGIDSCLFAQPGELPEVKATYRIESFVLLYGILFPKEGNPHG